MIFYPPPAGDLFTSAQRAVVDEIGSFLAENQYDQHKIGPRKPEMVDRMAAVCQSGEDQARMIEELKRLVRWNRLPGYYFTDLFQLSMKKKTARALS